MGYVQALSFEADTPIALIELQRSIMRAQLGDYHSQISTFKSELGQNKSQLATIIANINASKQRLTLLVKRQKALKILLDKGAYSALEFDSNENERLELAGQLSVFKAQKNETISAKKTIDNRVLQFESQWHSDLQTLRSNAVKEASRLRQDWIKATEKSRLTNIVSPVDGVVQQLMFHTVGGVVSSAQQIMVIVPNESTLFAQVNVLNQDSGFIRAGQKVEIKIDIFPYTKYGTIKGVVAHVSQDAVEDERLGWVFPAQIDISEDHIKLGGQSIPLAAGMSLMAEIKTDQRRIIDYVLSPLAQYQSEALRER